MRQWSGLGDLPNLEHSAGMAHEVTPQLPRCPPVARFKIRYATAARRWSNSSSVEAKGLEPTNLLTASLFRFPPPSGCVPTQTFTITQGERRIGSRCAPPTSGSVHKLLVPNRYQAPRGRGVVAPRPSRGGGDPANLANRVARAGESATADQPSAVTHQRSRG
jgi:hypothetical protein